MNYGFLQPDPLFVHYRWPQVMVNYPMLNYSGFTYPLMEEKQIEYEECKKDQTKPKYKDKNFQKNYKFRTTLCTHKKCRYAKCQFGHGFSQLRPLFVKSSYKSIKCSHFPYCHFGSRCDFLHENESLVSMDNCTQCFVLQHAGKPVAKICFIQNHKVCSCFNLDL